MKKLLFLLLLIPNIALAQLVVDPNVNTSAPGTVTSVGLILPNIITVSGSPVTSSGSLTGTLATQTANTIFSGPTTGAAASPTFRVLVTADLPTSSPIIQAHGRVTAQSAANSSIATYTPSADGTFEISGNVNVTAAVSIITTLTCTYTDESNAARTMIMPVAQVAGSFIAAGAITGVGAWETPVMHIRVKASTAITILTSAGTFTSATYTAEGVIIQIP